MLKVLLFVLVLFSLLALGVLIGAHLNPHPLPSNSAADRVLVEKSIRRLTLLRNGASLKTYRVALGRAPVGPKEQEGDQRTPEGLYRIDFQRRTATTTALCTSLIRSNGISIARPQAASHQAATS
jgi:hypothetical protein